MVFSSILLGIGITWFVLARYYQKKNHNMEYKYQEPSTDYEVSITFSIIYSCIVFLLLLFINTTSYFIHIGDLEELNVIDERIEIYEDRSEDIYNQLRIILVDEYSIHEKEIFNSISGEGISIYLAKYPELNAHSTFISLSETLKDLQNRVYEEKILKVEIVRYLNTRARNPFIISFILPKK